mgnify:CR=1 FL=1
MAGRREVTRSAGVDVCGLDELEPVDARGFDLQGSFSITYTQYDGERDPPCGWRGKHRFNLSGHPWYFRMQGDCRGRDHYIDLFVDESWLEEHPEHKPGW